MHHSITTQLQAAVRRGAWFGFRVSLAVFGGVFLAIYGATGAWLTWARLTRGPGAFAMLIDAEGGMRSLKAEVWMAAGRVVWLTACCTLLSAAIFALASLLSGRPASNAGADGPHPLDA